MDSEKKLPTSRVLPARKSKVFHKEPETPSVSPIWVQPSFAARDQNTSRENERIFKSKKLSFTPKTSLSLEAPSEETEPVETFLPSEDFKAVPHAQGHLTPKISAVFVASIVVVVLICFVLVGWLAYHQGFIASQNRIAELRT